MLEFWFPFEDIEFTRKRGIWCDGIELLTVASNERLVFDLAGVGYFPHSLSPFEIKFSFERRRDLRPSNIVLRFGVLNSQGELQKKSRHPLSILDTRPVNNSDWAIAVEITLPQT